MNLWLADLNPWEESMRYDPFSGDDFDGDMETAVRVLTKDPNADLRAMGLGYVEEAARRAYGRWVEDQMVEAK